MTLFSTEDIKRCGAKKICQKAFKIASDGTEGIHVSFDIDLIDPSIAPGVSVPAKNGININETYAIIDEIIDYKKIIKSIDIVEFNPLRDINDKTKNIAQTIYNKLINNIK